VCALVIALAGFALMGQAQIGGGNWTAQTPQFNVQYPYNVSESSRYTFIDGVYHMWVFSNDMPFSQSSTTLPRTEQRFTPDYTSGEIQYQAMLMADPTENSYCIFQIHSGDAEEAQYGSTTFMLFWFSSDGGSVHDYSGTELAANLGSSWFQLNVDHNVLTGTITVWINGQQVWQQKDNGAGDFYMKDGVYEQDHGPTAQMDAYVKNIQFWTSPGTSGSPDFSVAPNPAALTVQSGHSASTAISVTPVNGFNSPVSFACSGLPAGATCSFSPQTVTPSGAAASTTLTVNAAATTAALRRNSRPLIPGATLAVLLCCFGWKKRWRWPMLMLLAVSVMELGMLSGCGGAGSAAVSTPSQPQTSTVTVTATSGSLSHTTTFPLTLN